MDPGQQKYGGQGKMATPDVNAMNAQMRAMPVPSARLVDFNRKQRCIT